MITMYSVHGESCIQQKDNTRQFICYVFRLERCSTYLLCETITLSFPTRINTFTPSRPHSQCEPFIPECGDID